MKPVSESLAGRADVLELETLSWAEAHAAVPSLTLERFIVRGGFPELHQKPEIDFDGFYRSYVATYLERDLRQLLQVTSLRDFERFTRACALRTGQMLNRADLARNIGVSGSTAAAWLSVLEASGQVALLEPWFSNRTKSLVKSPKLYLCDSGLCAFLSGVRSPENLRDSPQAGALWETLVFGELRRLQIDHRGGWELHFWRDRAKEVDFLFHRGGKLELAEAKWTELPTDRDSAALRRLIDELGQKAVTCAAIVCRCRNRFPLHGSIHAIPLGELPPTWA